MYKITNNSDDDRTFRDPKSGQWIKLSPGDSCSVRSKFILGVGAGFSIESSDDEKTEKVIEEIPQVEESAETETIKNKEDDKSSDEE